MKSHGSIEIPINAAVKLLFEYQNNSCTEKCVLVQYLIPQDMMIQ